MPQQFMMPRGWPPQGTPAGHVAPPRPPAAYRPPVRDYQLPNVGIGDEGVLAMPRDPSLGGRISMQAPSSRVQPLPPIGSRALDLGKERWQDLVKEKEESGKKRAAEKKKEAKAARKQLDKLFKDLKESQEELKVLVPDYSGEPIDPEFSGGPRGARPRSWHDILPPNRLAPPPGARGIMEPPAPPVPRDIPRLLPPSRMSPPVPGHGGQGYEEPYLSPPVPGHGGQGYEEPLMMPRPRGPVRRAHRPLRNEA